MLFQIFNYISISILLIFSIGILIDVIPMLKDWLGRIHIGRYNDTSLWNRTITNRASKWLIKTPTIKVTDNTRLIFIDMIKRNYKNDAIQYWQEAALLLGLSQYMKHDRDKKLEESVDLFLKSKLDEKGDWKSKPKYVDAAILSYAIMNLNEAYCSKNKQALDYTWKLIKDHIGEDGTVLYRKSMPYTRYVDTIGFICPFLVRYGVKYNKLECIELAVKQIQHYEKYGMLINQVIPCHAYDVNTHVPLGLYGWGRGVAWYAIGLIDAYNELPDEHIYKKQLAESIKKLALSIIEFQCENGGWTWSITRKETRLDSSTTAALGWFLINAAMIEDINKQCLEACKNAISYLMKVTRKDGSIDFSQGDTKDIGVYSQLFNISPFTQGYAVRLINLIRQSEG
ncbi:hypothetical protein CPJCM30710_14050 [Clostridium polyendosporum]|uniref:Unsaturated rhamnogalacturonyl hydrolase n=1 Tax=Clostridium polyendosporum TaxID=69208 RepID=A0A919VE45_9CLOT|nr:glycoside hydrolase family 88 protein [Clostridium polyendosporum]GIM28739.1 hypothetical protein CPJCM30710_14050 [Clostridium polyendosporum]